ncbi:zinc-ribbon domain-containing protein [Ruminococcus sp. OA3]|uniref:zinc ribbon domain-containing protein n=1 Tax=Ruminococcus sp. OA3 TaxID=2914164 RepID=UPI001F056193|nr:zinc ribbon domain-containing protein [Ruminococcus sp. OA3]MCH1982209.1 zinc-ribbon domain-containing protein [Ruminococcus sp. OA3]
MPEINLEDLGKTISSAAENVSKKTEAFIESQRLKAQIHSAERSAEKEYKDLGELIFQRYAVGEAVDEEVAVICEEISQIQLNISELKAELAAKRGYKICPVCQAEVVEGAAYCMKCGSKIADEEPFEDDRTEPGTSEAEQEAGTEEEATEQEKASAEDETE